VSSWRVARRLTFRQARRRPGRTALIVALIGLPIAGVVAASTIVRSTVVGAEQTWRWQAGNADAVAFTDAGEPDPVAATEAFVAELPPGGRAVVTRTTTELVRRPDGSFADVDVSDLPLTDPLVDGVRLLRSGRAPVISGEAAVSPAVLEAAQAKLGDTLTLARSNSTVRITGTVVNPAALDDAVAVVGGGLDPRRPGTGARIYVDYPPGFDGVVRPSYAGRQFRLAMAYGPADHRFAPTPEPKQLHSIRLFGGVGLAVAGLVAAAAFAVSNRRHLRELGLLSAAGARPQHLVRVMAVEGVMLGVLGALAGLATGLASVVALNPHLDRLADHVTGGPRISTVDAAAVVGFGVVAAALAAWASARTAYWLPTLAALAGRRPWGRVPRHVPAIGAGLAGGGIGLIAWVGGLSFGPDLWWMSLAGTVAVVLGATALTPWVVSGLEPLSRRLRGPSRLALRSLARQRIRAAAVVAAVMAAGSLAVGGSTALLGGEALGAADAVLVPRDQVVVSSSRYSEALGGMEWVVLPDAVEATAGAVPGSVHAVRSLAFAPAPPGVSPPRRWSSLQVRLPVRPFPNALGAQLGGSVMPLNHLWVDGPGLLDAFGAPAGADAALAAVDAIVFAPTATDAPVTGTLVIERTDSDTLPVALVRTSREELWANVVIKPTAATRLGLEAVPYDAIVRAPGPLTAAQRRALDDLSVSFGRQNGSAQSVHLMFGRPAASTGTLRTLALAGALALTLLVVGLGLALVAAESRQEQALLRALGARPRAVRRTRVVQAVTLAGLGGMLAVPVGFGPTAAFLAGPGNRPVLFPTAAALAVTLAIPLAVAIAVAVTGWATAARPVSAGLLSGES
jgi:putative ABC transport system permease protein